MTLHISGAGTGGVLPEPPIVAAIANASAVLPGLSLPVNDSVGSLLQLISEISASHPPANAAVVTDLLRAAASAVIDNNVPLALSALNELVHRSPEHVVTLAAEPSLAPIRAQVMDLLGRVTTAAKVDAEVRLASATQLVESPRSHTARSGDWNAKDVLPVAAQLIDSGRHSNILLATDLSQAVIHYYGGFEIPSAPQVPGEQGGFGRSPNPSTHAPWAAAAGGLTEVLKKLWKRSPALLLLLMCALLGIVSAIAAALELCSVELSLEVWGGGSAGLLGFGTYQRLRTQPE